MTVIDETDVWRYTSGHCHSLALAIQRKTGLPMVGVNWNLSDSVLPGHVLVQVDENTVLDIRGSRQLVTYYDVQEVTEDDLVKWQEPQGPEGYHYHEPQLDEHTERVADYLIREYLDERVSVLR